MSKSSLIGHASCAECQTSQPVKTDPRKRYYLNCANCGTTSLYQSKKSKSRLDARLVPIATDEEKTLETQGSPQEITRTVENKSVGFLEALSEFWTQNETEKHG